MLYIWLFFLLLSMAALFFSFCRIRLNHFCRLAESGMLKKRQPLLPAAFFSSACLRKTVFLLLRRHSSKTMQTLLLLSAGKTASAEKFLLKKKEFSAYASLRAYCDYKEGIALFEKMLESMQEDSSVKAELAELYFITGKKDAAEQLLQTIPEKKVSAYVRAKKYFYTAQFCLQEGNMLNASEYAARAAALFRREKARVEEAKAYLLAGTIYRISAVEDVAHFMFNQAQKLFAALKYPAGEAEALGNLGMLWTMREKYDDAEGYFRRALEIYPAAENREFAGMITNQLALLYLLQKNFSEAENHVHAALELLKNCGSARGEAFCRELLAYLYCQKEEWNRLKPEAECSARLYEKCGDVSSRLECLYLKAMAEYHLNKPAAAEKLLRKIIDTAQTSRTCFHLGNAYNLLGLVFLAQNDLARAKALFMQSASWEQKEERFSGAATDYANIGLIEYRGGNAEQALRTYETALTYASAFTETELSAFLKTRIDELKRELE